jgi:hypothetical protein
MKTLLPIFVAAGLLAPDSLLAQVTPAIINATFVQGDRGTGVVNGSTASIVATAVGKPTTGRLTITYIGLTKLTFQGVPQVVGSPDIKLTSYDTSVPLQPLDTATFQFTYTPSSSLVAQSQFIVFFQDATGVGVFSLNLIGTVPEVVVSYALSSTANTIPLVNGDTIPFGQNLLNSTTDATVSLSNLGSASSQITKISVAGAGFQLLGLPLLPANLTSGSQLRVAVRYLPTVEGPATGSLSIVMDGNTFTAALTGTAFRSLLTYTLVRDTATAPLVPNQTVDLGDTKVGDHLSFTVLVRNPLTVPSTLTAIGINGAGFSIPEGPILPLVLQPQDQTSLKVTFAPQTPGAIVAHLAIGTDNFIFTARAVGPLLDVTYDVGSTSNPITPGSTAPFPNSSVGQSVSAKFTFKNSGTGPFSFISIGITDPTGSFKVTGLPSLPEDLKAGDSLSFGVTFAPQVAGKITASLDINGGAAFQLSGVAAAASSLVFSYRIGTTEFPIADQGSLTFPTTAITQTSSTQFTIKNTGASPASLVSIGLADTLGAFQLRNLPALPTQIAGNQSLTFTIDYKPQLPGSASATLSIDAARISLSGSAPAPPALPGYQFTGASGTQQPFQQPAVGLTLQSAYPLDLQGTLTLSVVSGAFSQDPAVRFSSGALTVAFTIPANQLQAVFPGGATQIQYQTGSVASTILITPGFSTLSGINLTPSNPTTARVDIPKLAPVLLTARITSQTATSLTIAVTGYTTTRTLTNLNFTFTGPSGQTVGQLPFDVGASSRVWFQSSASEAFGGQFTVEVPFTVADSNSSITDLGTIIRTVSVKVANEIGTSNAVDVAVP